MFLIDKRAGGLAQVVSEVCDIRHDIVCYKLFDKGYFTFTALRDHCYFWYKCKPKYVSLIVLTIVLFVIFCFTLTLVCMRHC